MILCNKLTGMSDLQLKVELFVSSAHHLGQILAHRSVQNSISSAMMVGYLT